ncbi:Helix-turn-helix domain-containing protein [Bifidobacterium ramosum]|uniref:Helix-turn-helix domain-containing protein n=1 Tax=Bifidobacterium ramosum TaxID=1798158 RepID=A0A6L4WYT9_9BIFI|nr:AraC family transcriptional regulator [Bifidobacterium ramosum]KAB8287287.1 Helix-turn-helix domain-containing protein [Bifidobacterium ramosum]NEG72444.1 helix-turn-helix domain-containing protein [Bifidobacterium ramosum]
MKPLEHHVDTALSNYYVYRPSRTALRTYLYPTMIGLYRYRKGYRLTRAPFDSFNLMMVKSGTFRFRTSNGSATANATARDGDIILLNCYAPNSYQASALTDSDVIWMHFDGIAARPYFDVIHPALGTVITVKRSAYAYSRMRMLYDVFDQGQHVSEARMSLAITEILTECMATADERTTDADELAGTDGTRGMRSGNDGGDGDGRDGHDGRGGSSNGDNGRSGANGGISGDASVGKGDGRARADRSSRNAVEEVLAYIAGHLHEPLPLAQLAGMALMSEYYFIRVFKRMTGYTPHTYIVNARMDAARYMLTSGYASLREICAECGFGSTSAFCSAFKRRYGCSPLEFRRRATDNDG